jgi:hypothetical protein
LRSNAARFDPDMDDMHAFEPQRAQIPVRARKPNAPPAVRSKKKPLALRFFLAAVRRPGRSLLFLAGSALVSSIMINALFLQKGSHPAPLFGASSSSTPSAPVSFPPPSTQTRNVTKTSAPEPFFVADAPAPEPPPRNAAQQIQAQPAQAPLPKAAPARNENFDSIGALLRGGAPVAPAQSAALNDPVQTKRIVAAQRALEKLGFQVSVDGLNGPGTRAAIQNFERERDLPVTGELNPRTLRVLAARSGVSIP